MKHILLFLAANPIDTDRLALDDECAAVERELRMTSGRDDFDFRAQWTVNIDELMRHLNELQPTILHFSGHSSAGTSAPSPAPRELRRDVESLRAAGIFFQAEGRAQYVSDRALARMIASASPSTRMVVLNACYSAAIAESLSQEVRCVIGMNGSLSDAAARSFAVAFYRALGNRRSLGNAIDQAVATLEAKQLADAQPVCETRCGTNLDHVYLSSLGVDRRAEPPRDSREDAQLELASVVLDANRPFVVCDPRRRDRAASARSASNCGTVSAALNAAGDAIRSRMTFDISTRTPNSPRDERAAGRSGTSSRRGAHCASSTRRQRLARSTK